MNELLDVIKPTKSQMNLRMKKVNIEEQVYIVHQKLDRLPSCYMSLWVNNRKLCNCILELVATDNIMPLKVAHILKINYTKYEDICSIWIPRI